MSRAAITAAALLCLGVAVWAFWPQKPVSEEEKVRQVIAALAQAAGGRDAGDLLRHVSDRYQGEFGDKPQLQAYLAGMILRSEAILAVPSGVEIEIEDTRADVTLRLTLARAPSQGGGAEDLLGSHLVNAVFEREPNGRWKLLAARRQGHPLLH